MSYRPKGKHVSIDIDSPRALGICDYTGFIFNLSDLVKQYQYRGDELVWTGYYVGRPYLDEPNEQDRPPRVLGDPFPVKDPRPPLGCIETFSNNTLPSISQITLPINQLGNIPDGAFSPSEDTKIALLDQGTERGIPPNLRVNGRPIQPEQTLTQAQILQQLQNASFTK